jgi:hypothetical protein
MVCSIGLFIVVKTTILFLIFFSAEAAQPSMIANFAIYVILALILIATFIRLVRLIRTEHNSQYLKLRRPLFLYFAGTFLYTCTCAFSNLLTILVPSILRGYKMSASDFKVLCESNRPFLEELNDFLFLYLTQLHLFDAFNSFIVVFIKNKDDVLDGFNKLSELMKVSLFQKFKEESKEEEKRSVFLHQFLEERTILKLNHGQK